MFFTPTVAEQTLPKMHIFISPHLLSVCNCPFISVREQTWWHTISALVFGSGACARACLHTEVRPCIGASEWARCSDASSAQPAGVLISNQPINTRHLRLLCCQRIGNQGPAPLAAGMVGMTMTPLVVVCRAGSVIKAGGQIRDCGGCKAITPPRTPVMASFQNMFRFKTRSMPELPLLVCYNAKVKVVNITFPQSKKHLDLWQKRSSE